jgi:type I restriction enzyme S subunit
MPVSAISYRNPSFRIDSEFFGKAGLEALRLVERHHPEDLGRLTPLIQHPVEFRREYADEGIPIVLAQNVRENRIVFGEVQSVSDELKELIAPNELNESDLLITRSGANFGQAASWNGEIANAHACADLLVIREPSVSSKYLSTYMASREGRLLVLRGGYGAGQPHIAPTYLRILPIPRFNLIENRIDAVCTEAMRLFGSTKSFLSSAEHAFQASLDLAGWMPPTPLSYPTSASLAISSARLDAEFFRPRIRELIGRLRSAGFTLRDVATPRREKFNPALPGEFEYIEIGDLAGDGSASSTRLVRSDAPSRATWHVHTGDVITSTVRPIRRLSALIEDHQDGFVCSSGFVVLQPVSAKPEVLLTYLRLPVFCELMNLYTSASMYPAISEKDLLALPFAPPNPTTEAAICDAVTNARDARRRATELLEAAKHAVEIAIEQSEEAALRSLERVEV